LRACPEDPGVRTLLGIGKEKTARLEDQIHRPLSNPGALARLGAVRLYEGDYRRALDLFAAARVANPRDPGALLGIGLAHLGAGRRRAARLVLFKTLTAGVAGPLERRALLALALARLPAPLGRGLWALTFAGL
jgi:Flp pilus assembly protein TadD